MTEFRKVRGFEDVWRPAARTRWLGDQAHSGSASGPGSVRARLARIAARTPEVMVKITGRTRDAGHARAHLEYISRHGALPLEGRDGERLETVAEIRDRARDWAADDQRRRADGSVSISIVLSMPAGTPVLRMRDAARAFAQEVFAERHDYLFALHTDVDHPHLHLSVQTRGQGGERLNPRKGDLDAWRQAFARQLRAHDIEAEATPRRARGVVRKAEQMPVRKLRDRHQSDPTRHPPPRVVLGAATEAARQGARGIGATPWEVALLERQKQIRGAYQAAADELRRSSASGDRTLADQLDRFISSLPEIETQRIQLHRNDPARGPDRSHR